MAWMEMEFAFTKEAFLWDLIERLSNRQLRVQELHHSLDLRSCKTTVLTSKYHGITSHRPFCTAHSYRCATPSQHPSETVGE